MGGDRICPSCEEESLIEKGLTTWECLNLKCKDTFKEEDLDADNEADWLEED